MVLVAVRLTYHYYLTFPHDMKQVPFSKYKIRAVNVERTQTHHYSNHAHKVKGADG